MRYLITVEASCPEGKALRIYSYTVKVTAKNVMEAEAMAEDKVDAGIKNSLPKYKSFPYSCADLIEVSNIQTI
jgi:hypothetical protein